MEPPANAHQNVELCIDFQRKVQSLSPIKYIGEGKARLPSGVKCPPSVSRWLFCFLIVFVQFPRVSRRRDQKTKVVSPTVRCSRKILLKGSSCCKNGYQHFCLSAHCSTILIKLTLLVSSKLFLGDFKKCCPDDNKDPSACNTRSLSSAHLG